MGGGFERQPGKHSLVREAETRSASPMTPGKRTLTEAVSVQRSASAHGATPTNGIDSTRAVHEAAAQGIARGSEPLPHAGAIQRLFGRHDISGIEAHVGGPAATASRAMGAEAYATGHHVAFASTPSLHTAAHEAAHVIQQRGGVQLKGGVGEVGDAYEGHADRVADLVVQGRSAESLLDQAAGGERGAQGRSGSVPAMAAVQQIAAKDKQFIGRQVTSRKNKKFGPGTITRIDGKSYWVDFGGRLGEKKLSAEDLDLVEEKKESPENNNNNNNSKKTTELEPHDGEKGNEKGNEKEKKKEQEKEPGIAPAYIVLVPSQNQWDIILLDESGQQLAIAEATPKSVAKSCYEQMTGQRVSAPKSGKYKVTNPEIPERLQKSYQKIHEDRIINEQLSKFSMERTQTTGEETAVVSQKDTMDRLWELNKVKRQTEMGNVSIMMTKIALDAEVILVVGGQARSITHLYTQPGNDTEIRCYLGNKDGAYQRVHTSLTLDKSMTAHTMVQTGELVTIPNVQDGGTRVGFDTEEGESPGFGERPLKIRSKKQCTVEGWLKGEDWTSLTEEQRNGCMLLANKFNEALDKVCIDISKGEVNKRNVTGIGVDFAKLDDTWLFGGKISATPEREWEHDLETRSDVK